MGIDETRKHNLSGTVDLDNLLAILQHPGIAQRGFRGACGNNLSADTQHRAIADEAKFFKFQAPARRGSTGRRVQSQELANVGKKQRVPGSMVGFP